MYVCDFCEMVRQEPGYVHLSWQEIKDAVTSGKFRAEQYGTPRRFRLIPVETPYG